MEVEAAVNQLIAESQPEVIEDGPQTADGDDSEPVDKTTEVKSDTEIQLIVEDEIIPQISVVETVIDPDLPPDVQSVDETLEVQEDVPDTQIPPPSNALTDCMVNANITIIDETTNIIIEQQTSTEDDDLMDELHAGGFGNREEEDDQALVSLRQEIVVPVPSDHPIETIDQSTAASANDLDSELLQIASETSVANISSEPEEIIDSSSSSGDDDDDDDDDEDDDDDTEDDVDDEEEEVFPHPSSAPIEIDDDDDDDDAEPPQNRSTLKDKAPSSSNRSSSESDFLSSENDELPNDEDHELDFHRRVGYTTNGREMQQSSAAPIPKEPVVAIPRRKTAVKQQKGKQSLKNRRRRLMSWREKLTKRSINL